MRTRGSLLAVIVVALACASAAAALTPNDPTWSQAWGQRQVNMPGAWDITRGDPSVIIGVIDTGVDPTIPDLQGALVPGWDLVDNDAVPQDLSDHGTLTTTELVARGNNGQGIAGYCWRCRVMPVRVSATGSNFSSYLTSLGIRWAVEHGARILSLGFSDEGTYSYADPQVAAAIAYAAQRNVLVFASSGNTWSSSLTHPAADPGAYAVAGTDPSGTLYPWSAFGSWIGLAAPGCQLMEGPGPAYQEMCGNSTSTPAVAGIAALMLSVNPSLTPAQVVSALQATAAPVAGIGGGRVDAYRALLAVGGKPPPPPPPPPAPAAPAPPRPPRTPPRPASKQATRVQKGILRKHRFAWIDVKGGRVAATLRSVKAESCTVSLRSSTDVWLSALHHRNVVSMTAKVPAGRYKVDVWCSTPRPRPFALVLRAVFA